MTEQPAPTFKQALAIWAKIGVLSFGGPAGQIALMHRVLVDEQRWIAEDRFLHALNFCMLLPGPEAMQLATYVGWRLQSRSRSPPQRRLSRASRLADGDGAQRGTKRLTNGARTQVPCRPE